ncbi:pyrroline-5-carboxylate reductase [Bisgaard Taxon 45]|uniref:Pyrroline-5-carboxylate reductase n=1 Tax=Bisgaard Taxon 45 TaxID=304289 RepID=A0ABT9KF35_9PAST|nr:pyrroline-5-carboxylate reductase [Bisgaard Taxon 45]
MQAKSICFIGGGNMAQAIIFGLLKQGYPAHQITVSDPHAVKRQTFAEKGINVIETSETNNQTAVQQSEVVLLAVKPQLIAEVCQQLSAVDFSQKLVISIAAGVSVAKLQSRLPSATHIVRVMPNTPALVSEGMSGLFAQQNVAPEYKQFTQDLLNAVGKTCWVSNETDMHAITAGSGSSPAYFFLLMEAMQHALSKMHIDEKTARLLVQQSALGAAKMVIDNPDLPIATLRENVTSKGGTTEAALTVFTQQQLHTTVQQAMQACVERSQQMEKLF